MGEEKLVDGLSSVASHCSTFAFTDEHVAYAEQYGGICRDCADECGICPHSGLPCGQSRKAIQHVLEAIQYGVRNGFVSPPFNTYIAALDGDNPRCKNALGTFLCERCGRDVRGTKDACPDVPVSQRWKINFPVR